MPDGRGSLFDVLDRAHARGVDVRVIFWRHLQLAALNSDTHFAGTEQERLTLQQRGSRFKALWDQAHGRYCQHQKCWLMDAGSDDEIAFAGGINLTRSSVVSPGHAPSPTGNVHDVYVEVRGPAATDVHHNFVQRWNEASDRHDPGGSWPAANPPDELPFPTAISEVAGEVPVQIQRTVRAGRYKNDIATPGGVAFSIAEGEFSIVEQYRQAIDAARSTIYIEDQVIGAPEMVDRLHKALERGVDVVLLVPIDPHSELLASRHDEKSKPFFESFAALGQHDHFLLAGLASSRSSDGYQNVYVHAKIALVDDLWCTIGSTNLANRSFYGDTELNASFWHGPTVASLRCELFHEHLVRDTANCGDREALQLFRTVARGNAERRKRGSALDGLAIALDPATYGS